MNLPGQILALAAAALLLTSGCSKDKKTGGDANEGSGSEGGGSGSNDSGSSGKLPSLTKLQPDDQPRATGGTIARKADGRWYEGASASPFTGVMVHRKDDQRWEEKFKNGVRTHIRTWDQEGEPVELHSWNADGTPKN